MEIFEELNFLDRTILKSFLIIGLLYFAKSAPQFIFDALGIKNKGNFMRMLGMGATAFAMGGSILSQLAQRNEKNPGHALQNFGASLFSGLAAGAHAGHALLSSDKPNWNTGINDLLKTNAVKRAQISVGATTMGGAKSYLQGLLFGQSQMQIKEIEWKEAEEKLKYDKQKNAERKTAMDRASSKGLESSKTSASLAKIDANGNVIGGFSDTVSGETYDFTANAALFSSAVEAAKSGVGVYKDVWYEGVGGTKISQADYDSLTDAQKNAGGFIRQESKESYFDFQGIKIDMRDVGVLQHEINDGNIADYYQKSVALDSNGNYLYTDFDTVIQAADERFAEANGGVHMEKEFGGTTGVKAKFGEESNRISGEEMRIANEKNSEETKRMQQEDKMFNNQGK